MVSFSVTHNKIIHWKKCYQSQGMWCIKLYQIITYESFISIDSLWLSVHALLSFMACRLQGFHNEFWLILGCQRPAKKWRGQGSKPDVAWWKVLCSELRLLKETRFIIAIKYLICSKSSTLDMYFEKIEYKCLFWRILSTLPCKGWHDWSSLVILYWDSFLLAP